jgi:hypothetical protein
MGFYWNAYDLLLAGLYPVAAIHDYFGAFRADQLVSRFTSCLDPCYGYISKSVAAYNII